MRDDQPLASLQSSTASLAPSGMILARWMVLALIVFCATGLRVYRLTHHSLWIDEIASLQLSNGRGAAEIEPPIDEIHPRGTDTTGLDDAKPWIEIFSAVGRDTHPPLYFLLLRYWRQLFGEGDATARSFSLVCSIGCIVALYDAANHLHGRSVGFWAAAIMAVATPQIVFAQEVRGYTMLSLFLLCAISAMARIQRLGLTMPRLAGLGIAVLAALFTHYTAIVALVAICLAVCVQVEGKARNAMLLSIGVAVVIFIILWGQTFWTQRQVFVENLAWTSDEKPEFYRRALGRLAALPLLYFMTPSDYFVNGVSGRFGAVLYFSPLLLIRRRDISIWIFLGVAIIGATAASDLLRHQKSLETLRFTFPAAPAAYVLFAIFAAATVQWVPRLPRWTPHVISAAVVLGCISSAREAYNQYWKTDLRGLTAQLDGSSGANDLMVIPYISKQRDWQSSLLLGAITHYSRYPLRPTLALSQAISPDTSAKASAMAPHIWFLNAGQLDPIDRFIPGAHVVQAKLISNAACVEVELSAPPPTTFLSPRPPL